MSAAQLALSKVPLGYPRVVNSGVRAMRVPIENFAGNLVCDSGAHTNVLELVVHAVTVTRDYQVFAARGLSILLDFKWDRYARRSFLSQLVFFLLHLIWTTAFTLQASQVLDDTLAPANIDPAEHWFFLFGWSITTVVSTYYLYYCYQRARAAGLRVYMNDTQEVINLLYNLFQVIVNILFWLRTFTPFFVFAPADMELTKMNTSYGTSWDLASNDPEVTTLRIKEAQDGETHLGLYLTLQSFVMLFLYMRVLFFFRGFRSFGSLMNMVAETTYAAAPLLLLILVVTLGFGLATHLLIQHTIFGLDPNFENPMEGTFLTVLNAGFRFIPPTPEPMRSRWQISVFYYVFMVFVQAILINLLVAMMASTFARLRANAQLVAMYEHAKLILEIDLSSHPERGRRWSLRRIRTASTSNTIYPRWLHVLMPPEEERTEDERRDGVASAADQQEWHGALNNWDESMQQSRVEKQLLEMQETLEALKTSSQKSNALLSQANAGTEAVSYIFLQQNKRNAQKGFWKGGAGPPTQKPPRERSTSTEYRSGQRPGGSQFEA